MARTKSDGARSMVDGFTLDTTARTDRALRSLHALSDAVDADPALGGVVADLLDAVLELVTNHHAQADLPSDELVAWQGLGAHFARPNSVAVTMLRSLAALAALRDASLEGEATVAARLSVDRSRIVEHVSERRLYAFSIDSVRWFPRWQFHQGSPLPNLHSVLRALDPDLHPLTVTHWFTTPDAELNASGEPVSPRLWLITGGKTERVVRLATQL